MQLLWMNPILWSFLDGSDGFLALIMDGSLVCREGYFLLPYNE
jgi:hypothetical protein